MYIASTAINNLPKTAQAPKPNRLQFGSLLSVTPFLAYLDRQPLAELVFKDVTAFNAPKIALARTWKERLDTAPLELSNTTITLLFSLFVPKLLRKPVSAISQVAEKTLARDIPFAERAATQAAAKMARLGVSFGFFFPFAAAFWAAPFFRNWLTMKRTQTANFESIIGFDGLKGNKPHRTLQEEMQYQKQMAWKILGIGVGLGALSIGGFGLLARGAMRKNAASLGHRLAEQLEGRWQQPWNRFFNYFDLKGKGANQIEGVPAQLIFWGMPAYLGWIHGARSGHERRERMIQSANALALFFFAPKLTKLLWNSRFLKLAGNEKLWKQEFQNAVRNNMLPSEKTVQEKFKAAFKNKVTNLTYDDIEHYFKGSEKQKKALTNLKNWQFAVSGLGIPITSLALVQLLNFQVTERKIKAAIAHAAHDPKAASKLSGHAADYPVASKAAMPASAMQIDTPAGPALSAISVMPTSRFSYPALPTQLVSGSVQANPFQTFKPAPGPIPPVFGFPQAFAAQQPWRPYGKSQA